MESKELLHPEMNENSNQEVNAGASNEAQLDAEMTEEATPVIMEESPVQEETTTEEPESNDQDSDLDDTDNISEMVSEIEDSNNTDESDEDETDEDETIVPNAETEEDIEREYAELSLEDGVGELEKVVQELDYNNSKKRVGILKANFLKLYKSTEITLLEQFLNEGGVREEYKSPNIEVKEKFDQALTLFKEKKTIFIEEQEKQKEKNLQEKLAIIEGLKELIESETTLKEKNDKYKEFQEKWKSIGPVPQNESHNLWQNFHFYVEKFFDLLRMNQEFRNLDFKKNLEQKIALCERAESLLLEDSINKSFKLLQQLHDEWKELGPVSEDKKEEIWERFKNASDQINQRRRAYYEKLYTDRQNSYNAKVVLCEQAEEIIATEPQNAKEYKSVSDRLSELLKVWKTLGPAPPKLNDEIWHRFKSALDKHFSLQKEFFNQLKEEQTQNYNLKINIAIQAEGIAERTDWRKATEEIIQLQKEWKEIGIVPRKYKDVIWKRFRAACDKFFANKAHYYANIKEIEAENLKKKEELVEKILTHEFGNDREENMQIMQQYQRQWTEIGHVPHKQKERISNEYRQALDQRFADLNISREDVSRDRFKSKIETILSDPNANRILDKERRFLINKMTQLKDEINLLENNLGFFANSKNADLLREEFSKKIETAKNEVKELEYKIKMMEKSKQ